MTASSTINSWMPKTSARPRISETDGAGRLIQQNWSDDSPRYMRPNSSVSDGVISWEETVPSPEWVKTVQSMAMSVASPSPGRWVLEVLMNKS